MARGVDEGDELLLFGRGPVADEGGDFGRAGLLGDLVAGMAIDGVRAALVFRPALLGRALVDDDCAGPAGGVTAVEDAAQGVHLVVGVFDVLVGVDGRRARGNPGEFNGTLG